VVPKGFCIEVFLVDDGSHDGTGKAVKEKFPHVNIIQGTGNLFWNKGMNMAWQNAAQKGIYDFYLWLNDDVLLETDFITTLLTDFDETKKEESIIVGACKSEKGYVTYSGYRGLRKKQLLQPMGETQLCDYFNGNVVLIPAVTFKSIGFLDPIYHHGQGDFDYGLRAKRKGISSYVSSVYVGTCERNRELPRWCNPNYAFPERWKSFNSPLGGRPKSTLIFQRKYMGLPVAVYHYFTIHLRLIFPGIWKKEIKEVEQL
jgi:GT2 family glycosyltransferase